MLYNNEEEVIVEEGGVEDTPAQQEDNSTIKTLRKELKTKNEEIKKLNSQVETLNKNQSQIDKLIEKDLINTYGKENLEDAKKLIEAGFDETKIKSMLNKTDDLSGLDDPDPELNNINGNGTVEGQEDEVDEVEKYRQTLSKIDR